MGVHFRSYGKALHCRQDWTSPRSGWQLVKKWQDKRENEWWGDKINRRFWEAVTQSHDEITSVASRPHGSENRNHKAHQNCKYVRRATVGVAAFAWRMSAVENRKAQNKYLWIIPIRFSPIRLATKSFEDKQNYSIPASYGTRSLLLCKIWGIHGGDYEECSLLGCGGGSYVNRRFGETYRLHLQGRKISKRGTSVSSWLWGSIILDLIIRITFSD
jgi:hypothetical protein